MCRHQCMCQPLCEGHEETGSTEFPLKCNKCNLGLLYCMQFTLVHTPNFHCFTWLQGGTLVSAITSQHEGPEFNSQLCILPMSVWFFSRCIAFLQDVYIRLTDDFTFALRCKCKRMIAHLYMSAPSDGTGKLPRVNPAHRPVSAGITSSLSMALHRIRVDGLMDVLL